MDIQCPICGKTFDMMNDLARYRDDMVKDMSNNQFTPYLMLLTVCPFCDSDVDIQVNFQITSVDICGKQENGDYTDWDNFKITEVE